MWQHGESIVGAARGVARWKERLIISVMFGREGRRRTQAGGPGAALEEQG